MHSLPSCELPSELGRGNLELTALGDFPATNDAAEVLPLGRAGASLRFPAATRAVVARVAAGARAFVGYAERRADSGLDVLLWPEWEACPLPSEIYPGKHGGQALGFSKEAGRLLVVGGNDPLDADSLLGWMSFDVGSGALSVRGRSEAGAPIAPRAFASVTPFGSRLLVAGGERPVMGVPDYDIEPYALGEVLDPTLGEFTGGSIALHSSRTHHAAVVLDDGRTLLVGGRAKIGGTSIAQYQLELVDPTSERATLGDAITPRIDPTAVRLSDGRIFVGGGTALDGAPVTPVGEWLTPSGERDRTRIGAELGPRFERAFVATPGGGVLAVGGCEDRPAASEEDARACARCRHGCEPLDGYDAWWIDADGRTSPISVEGIALPRPILLPGSDGSPWLVAAPRESPDHAQLFRFNPWKPGFEPVVPPSSTRLPQRDMPPPLALGLDTFVWLEPGARRDQLVGLRLGTRSRYSQDLALVLLADPLDPSRPRHLTPDRPAGGSVSYDGKLRLRDADVTILLADVDYADVTITLKLAEASPPPLVLLGSTPLGGAECPWPAGDGADPPRIVRRGQRALLSFRGGEPRSCPVEPDRLSLGLRAGQAPSTITELQIRRSAE